MDSSTTRGVGLSLMLLATVTIMAAPAAAQQPARHPPGAVVQPLGQDNGAELRRHLTTLADNPRSLDALIGAGRAALQTGDAEASLSFFARADELSPRNGRIKAGMASALVQMGRAQAALNLFAQAVALGAPETEIAGDRGLAFDITGNPRRAQQDYTLALRRRDDSELRRRMALSLAISGERDAALRAIDAQLRRNDRAAWRTQAFVLALTGDAAGADRTARGSMPPGAAQAMAPFLARLAALSPAQKAMAVHFGHFPSDGRARANAGPADTSADPGAVALAMGGAPPVASPRPSRPVAAPPVTRRRPGNVRSNEPAARRRAGAGRDSGDRFGLRGATAPPVRAQRRSSPPQPAEPRAAEQRPAEVARVDTRWAGAPTVTTPPPQTPPPAPTPSVVEPATPSPRETPSAPSAGSIVTTSPSAAPLVATPQRIPATPRDEPPALPPAAPPPIEIAAPEAAPPAISAPVEPPPAISAPVEQPPTTSAAVEQPPAVPDPATRQEPSAAPGFTVYPPTTQAAEPQPEPLRQPLGDIASIVNALPAEEPPSRPAVPVQRRVEPARPPQGRTSTAPARPAAARPAHPSRHWVQIAGGANKAGLPREFARLRTQAPELAGRGAWTTPLNATNRLLVGPFGSAREAQEFVNRLAQRQVAAFAWTSQAGQEIERLPAGR